MECQRARIDFALSRRCALADDFGSVWHRSDLSVDGSSHFADRATFDGIACESALDEGKQNAVCSHGQQTTHSTVALLEAL